MTIYTVVQLPRDRAKWPQTLFFYEPGKTQPSFKFTRESRTTNWVGHGFYSMSRDKVEAWVNSGAAPLPGSNRSPRTDKKQLAVARSKLAKARENGTVRMYINADTLEALIKMVDAGA